MKEATPVNAMKPMNQLTRLTLQSCALLLALLVGAVPALAQEQQQQQEKPEFVQQYEAAVAVAKEAQALEGENPEEAAARYAEAYQQLADAARMADEEGASGTAGDIRQMAAKLAYRAGQQLYKNDMDEASIEHFEAGIEIDPSFAQNRQGLEAAQNALRQGPVVEASQALRANNPQQALDVLEGVEEENANVYYYRAEAYLALQDYENAIAAADQALEAGGLSGSRQGRLHLIRGESYMQTGNNDAAKASLEQAQTMGSSEVSARAKALLEQIG